MKPFILIKKCIKSKKCNDIYEESPTQLKVIKGGKENRVKTKIRLYRSKS